VLSINHPLHDSGGASRKTPRSQAIEGFGCIGSRSSGLAKYSCVFPPTRLFCGQSSGICHFRHKMGTPPADAYLYVHALPPQFLCNANIACRQNARQWPATSGHRPDRRQAGTSWRVLPNEHAEHESTLAYATHAPRTSPAASRPRAASLSTQGRSANPRLRSDRHNPHDCAGRPRLTASPAAQGCYSLAQPATVRPNCPINAASARSASLMRRNSSDKSGHFARAKARDADLSFFSRP